MSNNMKSQITTPNGTIYEKNLIAAELTKLDINSDYEIVTAENPDIVENTAAETLKTFLGKAGVNVRIVPEPKSTSARRFLLGQDSNLKAITRLGNSGKLKIRDVSAEDDGFHLKRIGQDLVMAGANPRGVLYAVYAFEEFIRGGARGSLDIRKVPHFRKRSNAVGYYWDFYVNPDTDEFTEEKAAYLARLGVNQYCSCDDMSGVFPHLHYLVKSDVFPFQNPPNQKYRRKVKSIAAVCKKYGIDYHFQLMEPGLPHFAADLAKYPPEALGTAKRPWGGDAKGLERTLCVNSPIVQAYYRDIVKKFVAEFDDVKGFFLYNLDASSWLCTPGLCERCAKAVKDSPHDRHDPWESQAKLVSVLAEAAHEARPEFQLNFWGDVHFHGKAAEKLLHHVQGCDAFSTGWDGSDHDIMITAVKEPCEEFRMTQAAAENHGVPMYVYFAYNRLESIPKGFPFPFHVCAALKKFKTWGVNHLLEVNGPTPAYNSINGLTMQAFQCNPDQDPVKFLSALSVKQFGPVAGDLMFKAWKEIKAAMDVWNDYPLNPLSGSQAYLSIGTPGGLPEVILPTIAGLYNHYIEIRTCVEPWRAADYQKLKSKACLLTMEQMSRHLAQAARFAKQATDKADRQNFIETCDYAGSSESTSRPTRKEYAELNHAPIAIADALCRQRINILRAYHLLTELESARANGNAKSIREQEALYRKLIREDIGVQERFCDLLTRFAGMRPCYTRTSLTEREIADFLAGTQTKIAQLSKFLEG